MERGFDIIAEILIYSLIVYRVSTDLSDYDGPFELFALYRGYIQTRASWPQWIKDGSQCPVCISFWLSCILIAMTQQIEFFAVAGLVKLVIEFRNALEQR
jgi:hypothetical protein